MKYLIAVILYFAWTGVTEGETKTILFIFPHPDDETAVAEMIVKWKREGYDIRLMIATNGKDGTRVTKIPAGDSLGNIRKDESRCGAQILGIEPPIFLEIERLDTKIGVGAYFKCHSQFRNELIKRIPEIDPDVIITFGPDGDTHHSEHIVTGSVVTEVLLQQGWVEKYPLYYVAWTKEQAESSGLGYMDPKYFNVTINYTQEDETKGLAIMPCYKTQYTPEEMAGDRESKLKNTNHVVYLRRFAVSKEKSRKLF